MEKDQTEFFEISAVARLTGISPHVLRVWERRYGVVEPGRSESGRRRYTREDIQRLGLLKSLVDNGHAIGSVANLSTAQLEDRLAGVLGSPAETGPAEPEDRLCRLAIAGTLVVHAVREAAAKTPALRVVGEFATLRELVEALRPGAVDLLVVERDTVFPEDLDEIRREVSALGVRRAVVVYRFARGDVMEPLDLRRIAALRAPVDASEIQLAFLADTQLAARPLSQRGEPGPDRAEPPGAPPGDGAPSGSENGEIPPRAYSDEQLVRIGELSTVVQCECPRHLASLLSGLAAFERYSEQCENRSEEDAALHAFLHRTTAQCRARMEQALAEVLAQEGIRV